MHRSALPLALVTALAAGGLHGAVAAQPGPDLPRRIGTTVDDSPLVDPEAPLVARARRNEPATPGRSVVFDVDPRTGPGPLQFSWDFGDGTPPTPWSGASRAQHAYAAAGHYRVQVTVRAGARTATDGFVQTIHNPLTALRPTHSSTIALDERRDRVWCVNADNDTVTAIDARTFQKLLEVPVGDHPRTLGVAPDGTIWVACQDDATVRVLDPLDGAPLATIALPYASAPYGLAMAPDGGAAYVTLRATGAVARLDLAARRLHDTTAVGPDPKGIAIAADSERIFVTRFRSSSAAVDARRGAPPLRRPTGPTPTAPRRQPIERDPQTFASGPTAEIYELSAARFAWLRTIPLVLDPGPDTGLSGRGLPNFLSSLTISPDGLRLWVTAKKDNIERGLYREGQSLSFETTVRTIVCQIDLATHREDLAARFDFNDRDMAFAVVFSPLGDYAMHALQGSNAVDVCDAYSGARIGTGIDGTGRAPQGLVTTRDGRTLFVHNFMSRTITAYEITGVTASTSFFIPLLANIPTVAAEVLPADVLRGKQIFYDASDPRMSKDGYLSCASCHLDGDHDGRVWDFTDRGEGLRNTISLLGKAGTGHGRVHWTANFDEIQDFENDIRTAFAGLGFMSPPHFAATANPLGRPKAGFSADLDALAAYVASLDTFPRSPHRNPDGTLTAAGRAGKLLFQQLSCAQCHAGPAYTDSATGALHDVGTMTAGSGQRLGEPLPGLDTPTLRGLWATAPYLHDGSARTLHDVLTTRNPLGRHGATASLTAQQRRDLVAYLLQIDGLEPNP